MKKIIITDKKIDSLLDRNSGAYFENYEFRHCYFESCAFSITKNPKFRSQLTNSKFVECSQRGCSCFGASLENLDISSFDTKGQLFQIWGAIFNKVIFRGRIGRIMISPLIFPGIATPDEQTAFDKERETFYTKVKMALDISEAEFEDLDLRGIPSPLIRRDLDTQAVFILNKIQDGKWQKLKLNAILLWQTYFQRMLNFADPDLVVIAPKRGAQFKTILQDINLLRKAGIAEPF